MACAAFSTSPEFPPRGFVMVDPLLFPVVAEKINRILKPAPYNVQLRRGGKVHHAHRKSRWPLCRALISDVSDKKYQTVKLEATCKICIRNVTDALAEAKRINALTREHLLAVQQSRLQAKPLTNPELMARRGKEQAELAHIKDLLSRSSLGTRTKRRSR